MDEIDALLAEYTGSMAIMLLARDATLGYDQPVREIHRAAPRLRVFAQPRGVHRHRSLYGEELVDAATLRLATTPPALPGGSETQYGFGWFVDTYRNGGEPATVAERIADALLFGGGAR